MVDYEQRTILVLLLRYITFSPTEKKLWTVLRSCIRNDDEGTTEQEGSTNFEDSFDGFLGRTLAQLSMSNILPKEVMPTL